MSREPIVTLLVAQAPATTLISVQSAPINFLQFGDVTHAPPPSIISVQAAPVSILNSQAVTLPEVDVHIASALKAVVGTYIDLSGMYQLST